MEFLESLGLLSPDGLYERSLKPVFEDDYDDDCGGCPGWLPKDSVEAVKVKRRNLGQFECVGTLMRHRSRQWSQAGLTERRKHSATGPAYQKTQKIESLTPCDCDVYWEDVWIQCPACYDADRAFEKWSRKLDAERREQQAAQIRQQQTATKKRKRDETKAQAAALTTQRTSASPDVGSALTAFKRLKQPQLKALCQANHLMVSGTKNELAMRLTLAKLHGGPGPCPRCGKSNLEVLYQNDGITPTKLQCKHRSGPMSACRYSRDLTSSSSGLRPLQDDADGSLATIFPPATPSPPSCGSNNNAAPSSTQQEASLSDLQALLDEGILTSDEFEAEKAKLLIR